LVLEFWCLLLLYRSSPAGENFAENATDSAARPI
jgi:hypothetical protein